MYEHNPSEYKSVDFINNCGSWCSLFISWHGYFVQNFKTLISYRPMIGTITHDDSSMLDKLRATNHLFFWPYFPRIIKLTNVQFFKHAISKIVKTAKLWTEHYPKNLIFFYLDIYFEICHMNWNFKKTSEFSWILFRITCKKPCIKTSIVMHVHYMNIR